MGARVRSTGATVVCRAPRGCPMSATHGMAHPWPVDGGHDPPALCRGVGDDPSWAGSSSIVKWAKVHQELSLSFSPSLLSVFLAPFYLVKLSKDFSKYETWLIICIAIFDTVTKDLRSF